MQELLNIVMIYKTCYKKNAFSLRTHRIISISLVLFAAARNGFSEAGARLWDQEHRG